MLTSWPGSSPTPWTRRAPPNNSRARLSSSNPAGPSARAPVSRVYQVRGVKTQPGGRTFVAVDGGMSDNPRVSLYGAKYTVALANRHSLAPKQRVTVAGRHCESGDEIARDVELPADVHPGDLLAVACTGAYHHSMASNYNMVGRPPTHRGQGRSVPRIGPPRNDRRPVVPRSG